MKNFFIIEPFEVKKYQFQNEIKKILAEKGWNNLDDERELRQIILMI